MINTYYTEEYGRNTFLKEPIKETIKKEVIGHNSKDYTTINSSLSNKLFTVDCIYYDIENSNYINPVKGIEHCLSKTLSFNPKLTYSNPVEVLDKIFEYIARFDLKPDFDFAKSDRIMINEYSLKSFIDNLREISIYKLPYIDKALNYFKENNVFKHIFEELDVLSDIEQSKVYHKEGNVWKHTVLVTKAIEKECKDNRFVYILSAILHDLGKALTTYWNVDKGDYSAKNHEIVSAKIIEKIFKNILKPNEMNRIVSLVANHMLDPLKIKKETCIKKADEFIKYGINWEMIMKFRKADRIGRDNGQFNNDMFNIDKAILILKGYSVYNMPLTDKTIKETITIGDKINSVIDNKILLK